MKIPQTLVQRIYQGGLITARTVLKSLLKAAVHCGMVMRSLSYVCLQWLCDSLRIRRSFLEGSFLFVLLVGQFRGRKVAVDVHCLGPLVAGGSGQKESTCNPSQCW